mgnify:CR=1 FL=1
MVYKEETMKTMADYYSKLHDYREAQLLLAGIKLNVFSCLDTSKTAKEVAQVLKYNVRNLDIFLRSLASIGLVDYRKNKYKNTESTNLFLNANSSNYIGDAILFREEMMSLKNLEDRIINGPNRKNQANTELFDFYRLAEVSRNEMYHGRVQNALYVTSTLFTKEDEFKVLDLGGGSGTLALEIVKKYPCAKAVVFEHPTVAKLPKKLIKEEKLESRVQVIEGDFNTDNIGESYNLIIASGVMDFAHEHLESLTAKLYDSLEKNGGLYIVTHGVNKDYLFPKKAVVGWLSGRLNGSDALIDEDTIIKAILQKGFIEKKMEEKKNRSLSEYIFIK